MPSINITASSSSATGGGVPTNTGTAFIAGTTDQGPPVTGPAYVRCLSLADYTSAFGARSSTSAQLNDWLDEFFRDGGQQAYVTRVSDGTAATASLQLNDVAGHPTVKVSALTPGLGGNGTFIAVVAASAATFTANTTSASPNLTAVSSVTNLGVGTPVSGAGIPAGTTILSVGSGTAVMSANATATGTGVTVTPSQFSVLVEDSSSNILETHGPYASTVQLFADTSSTYVSFAQSAATGFTVVQPLTAASTALAGGLDASDLTDANSVSALAAFPATLGPGTVALPGKTSATAWAGLLAHAQANNRWAAMDVADSAVAATVASAVSASRSGSTASYGEWTVGQAILPGVTPGTVRYAAGSACVAALRAQVAQTASQNQAPCGVNWPLSYPIGFTEFYGPAGATSLPAGQYSATDVQTLEAAGVNVFANLFGTLCLYGFVSPVAQSTDATYWQASAAAERMSLVSDCTQTALPFQFETIDGGGNLITAYATALKGVLAAHAASNALYSPGIVDTASPVNTNATAALGQLNALLKVQISPYADTVNGSIVTIPITLALV